jgi:sugar-specific transcriptional regulator TrmB
MDDRVIHQLKESRFQHPEFTEVILEPKKMFEIGLSALTNVEYMFDIVWDRLMLDFVWNYFREGIKLAEKQAEERNVKFRLITEVTKENLEYVNSIRHHEIRHINNMRTNFAIMDERSYMVQIFHKEDEPPSQAFFSNSKSLVESQQELFNRLWNIATPLANRLKEIEYQEKLNYLRIITGQNEIRNEISSIVSQVANELIIFSSFEILHNIFEIAVLPSLESLKDRGIKIKILVDNTCDYFQSKINSIYKEKTHDLVQIFCLNKLGRLNEMILIGDSKFVLQVRHDRDNKLIASFTNEKHKVQVQEIMFEKYRNEIKTLDTVVTNRS